ncbi:unnamed protein product [Haemonchus placei]|uniref:Integrase catalytic domain-containing protein n=1 Tax=Haemonchus placei TaxID=6290 RepID=A0A0N4W4E1_HAEPC|nr:unnamed protein product [Haemonchus placei]
MRGRHTTGRLPLTGERRGWRTQMGDLGTKSLGRHPPSSFGTSDAEYSSLTGMRTGGEGIGLLVRQDCGNLPTGSPADPLLRPQTRTPGRSGHESCGAPDGLAAVLPEVPSRMSLTLGYRGETIHPFWGSDDKGTCGRGTTPHILDILWDLPHGITWGYSMLGFSLGLGSEDRSQSVVVKTSRIRACFRCTGGRPPQKSSMGTPQESRKDLPGVQLGSGDITTDNSISHLSSTDALLFATMEQVRQYDFTRAAQRLQEAVANVPPALFEPLQLDGDTDNESGAPSSRPSGLEEGPPHIPTLPVNQLFHDQSVRLPKFDLPVFTGDIAKFAEFWDDFDSAVHSNRTIPSTVKFHYLRTSLKGEALSMVAGFEITDVNYQLAINILRKTYSRPSFLRVQLSSRLQQLKPATASALNQRITIAQALALPSGPRRPRDGDRTPSRRSSPPSPVRYPRTRRQSPALRRSRRDEYASVVCAFWRFRSRDSYQNCVETTTAEPHYVGDLVDDENEDYPSDSNDVHCLATHNRKQSSDNPRLMVVTVRARNNTTLADELLVSLLDSGAQHSFIESC